MREVEPGASIATAVEMSLVMCAMCGVPFCLPTVLHTHRLADGKAFTCPNGHPNTYKGEMETLKKENASLKEEIVELRDRAAQNQKAKEINEADRAARVAPVAPVIKDSGLGVPLVDGPKTQLAQILTFMKDHPKGIHSKVIADRLKFKLGSVSATLSSAERKQLVERVSACVYKLTDRMAKLQAQA